MRKPKQILQSINGWTTMVCNYTRISLLFSININISNNSAFVTRSDKTYSYFPLAQSSHTIIPTFSHTKLKPIPTA